ncbi:L-type lectin-domain containing receptor kinase SIT2-like [Cryptomeria japonica]|uniref:L-type lectin-domain containing receptor kinase SIT2-like n=1 Tax=Cryptomeria japonica TaxID=3369 RepID=UPI0025AC06D7|nr:L-type lectin-domain containing receptor kinase SIT2-like [Cryptomeria japonica]
MFFIIGILLLSTSLPVRANTTFIFDEFNGSALAFYGNASIQSKFISLTSESPSLFGRALYAYPVRMRDSLSFSTTFVFNMVPSASNPSLSGHGLAFIITPHKSPVGALAGQYLGLFNISTIGKAYNHLFAVEFDTGKSEEFQDINNNHVGVDLNDLTSVDSKAAGYWTGDQFEQLTLNNGQSIQAWIDYSHPQKQLNVTITQAGSLRPQKPLLSLKNTSLWDILEEEMYVGFSGATGTMFEKHYILAWSFSTIGAAPVLNISNLPSSLLPNKSKSWLRPAIVVALVVPVFFCVAAAVICIRLKRNMYKDDIEEWEMEYWPHRFSYKDLYIATKGFRDDQILGSGGFGRVYKGVLASNGLEVAIKFILRHSTEGMKEFVAEISSLGRLQHRNLVQIRGYCRRGTHLFIVYDYMPNGSLDKMIFGKPKKLLGWPQWHRILRDVAAGLLYLHEEWEQTVLHRDIKSSNVLLDSELRGKLGDFGLARLYEHNENPQTSRVVGTIGYIAPELIRTGKATPGNDVFSFGVFMLEVACGRRPVDPSRGDSQEILVQWVRELYANDKVIDAADSNLDGEFAEEELEKVLKLGLLCCNTNAEARISIRQVVRILEGEDSIPEFFPFPISFGMDNFLKESDSLTASCTWPSSSF